MAASEVHAVRAALASYLQTALVNDFPMLKVSESWPQGTALPEQAVTVMANGEHDTFPHAPIAVSVTLGSGATGDVVFEYAKIEGLHLDLDCWATTKPKRDALVAALRRALNRPPQLTLAGANDARPRFSRRSGLSLAVADLYGAVFTFRFTAVPSVPEGSQQAQRNEWRAHFRGTAEGPLWEQDQAMALRKHITLTGKLGPEALGHGGVPISLTRG